MGNPNAKKTNRKTGQQLQSSATATSSSATMRPYTTNACTSCPSNSTSVAEGDYDIYKLISNCLYEQKNLEEELKAVKRNQEKEKNLYDSVTSMAKTSKIVMLVLMAVPVIQVIVCAVIIYSLGIQDELPSLLSKGLGGIGVASVVEVLLYFYNSY